MEERGAPEDRPGVPDDLAVIQAAVLAWYDRERRDLPFRRTHDPYLILVSEAMAQQTQIDRAATAWTSFVERFPTVETLAVAPLGDVLRAWAGLGYNRRAVHLQRAARAIVADHGGVVPDEPAVLETLPGVGPYTARAVAAIAFGRPVGAVDTNVRRVLPRLVGRELTASATQRLADAFVPPNRAADWTAALMDIGSRHCRPRPKCDGCPVRAHCPSASTSGGEARMRERRRPARQPVVRPFESTSRWLRGRIVATLRAALADGWHRFDGPIGGHDAAAVNRALCALVKDGLVELHEADPTTARLAPG
ncbi:MAG TPA: A/G-specific adenine glycosylase [Candidatus Limnocylindrales bacterium]|nr:A/G-specific adenine glycosylase [Candidatus Limnocylindrales bacterium]